jgi:hypothetical protein
MDLSAVALLAVAVFVGTAAKNLMSASLVALALTHVLQLTGNITVRRHMHEIDACSMLVHWSCQGSLQVPCVGRLQLLWMLRTSCDDKVLG